MRIIRQCVFETNSSSTHSLNIVSEEDFDAWKCGKLLYDEDEEVLVPAKKHVDTKQKWSEEYIEENTTKISNGFIFDNVFYPTKEDIIKSVEIDDDALDGFIEDHDGERHQTYEEYFINGTYETFEQHHTIKGIEIAAFGYYGYS